MSSETILTRLSMNDIDWATELLTEAFLNEPPVPQLFHEPWRKQHANCFMKCSCAYALLFGECHTTPQRDGVALWLLPGKTAMTQGRMYQAGMLSAPFKLGLIAFSRLMRFASHTDKFHKEAAPMPHYYLFVLGVKPSVQGKGAGGFLLKNMLERIDREKMPAYLETQKQSNVGLYQRYGFEVTAHGAVPKLAELENWGMLRKAAV